MKEFRKSASRLFVEVMPKILQAHYFPDTVFLMFNVLDILLLNYLQLCSQQRKDKHTYDAVEIRKIFTYTLQYRIYC